MDGEVLGDLNQDEYKSYQALTKDNPFGGAALHRSLVRSYGGEDTLAARQELRGEFILMEGLVYESWNSAYHIKPKEEWPITKAGRKCKTVVAGVDFGHENPFAVIVEGYDSETKTRYILDEYCRSHLEPDDQARICVWLQRRHNIEVFYCDATNPTMIKHLRSWGVPAIRAKNRKGSVADPSFGIGAVSAALNSHSRDGKQGFYVDPRCKRLSLEMETYTEDEPKKGKERSELPKGSHHDTCDALRYSETGLLRHIGRSSTRKLKYLDVVYR
jgi:phage terminase large subunit